MKLVDIHFTKPIFQKSSVDQQPGGLIDIWGFTHPVRLLVPMRLHIARITKLDGPHSESLC